MFDNSFKSRIFSFNKVFVIKIGLQVFSPFVISPTFLGQRKLHNLKVATKTFHLNDKLRVETKNLSINNGEK
jgi:hypothetical protein